MKQKVTLFITVFIVVFFAFHSFSQCKNSSKDICLQKLTPFIYNGQYNSVVLSEGDIAELVMTCYSGQEYRIFLCTEDKLGKVIFNLYDSDRTLIYSNKDHNYANYWDFAPGETQQLSVEVVVPKTTKTGTPLRGCITILAGFKSAKK